jgi:hypothetical protein
MDSLPNEMKTYLCSFLDGKNAAKMSAVSRLYRVICTDEKLWSGFLKGITYRLQYVHIYYNKYFENFWNSMLEDPEKDMQRDFGRWFVKALSLNGYNLNDAFICCVMAPSNMFGPQFTEITRIAQICKEKIIEYIRIPIVFFLKRGDYRVVDKILRIDLLSANERVGIAKKVILNATEQNDLLLAYCIDMIPKDRTFFAYKLRKIWKKAEDKPHVRKFLKEYAAVNEHMIIGSFAKYGNNLVQVNRIRKWLDEIL